MNKEDAMDYLARCADESDPEYSAAVALAVSALRAQVEAEKRETPVGWISVKDKLPADMGNVLVVAFWHENWQVLVGWYGGYCWRVCTHGGEVVLGMVSHWMPLPKPPEPVTP